jgi:hypothetical protein
MSKHEPGNAVREVISVYPENHTKRIKYNVCLCVRARASKT